MNTDKLDKAITRLERAKRLLLNPALRFFVVFPHTDEKNGSDPHS